MIKRFIGAVCAALLIGSVCAQAAEIRVLGTDSNIIRYSVEADGAARVISALYSSGKLYSVNEGAGGKVFYAPAEKECVIKVYSLDSSGGVIDRKVTESIHTGACPYLEKLIVFLPSAQLEDAAVMLHERIGGDMAEIVPDMAVNPALYDTVFVGCNTKNGVLDPAAQKMFDTYDFGRATIVPFMLGEANGTDRYISTLEPNALVEDAFNIKGASELSIEEWLDELGF